MRTIVCIKDIYKDIVNLFNKSEVNKIYIFLIL
jgi:hypothetical protein